MSRVEDLQIMVQYKGKKLYRDYIVVDGNAPEATKKCVQNMMDVIKESERVPF